MFRLLRIAWSTVDRVVPVASPLLFELAPFLPFMERAEDAGAFIWHIEVLLLQPFDAVQPGHPSVDQGVDVLDVA